MRFSANVIKWLDRIVRPFAVTNLPGILVAAQAVVYVACLSNPALMERLLLNWDRVFEGEVWRLFTFMWVAPVGQPIFAIFYFYILYMMANYLESVWGTVRLCSFVYFGLFLIAVAGLFVRGEMISGSYVYATLFLAFATLNPNFTFMIMFILPVPVKYLAWLQAAGYLFLFTVGGPSQMLLIAASVGNYLLFFGDELWERGTGFHRSLKWQAQVASSNAERRHVCTVCGIDSVTHREMDFRYCSKCDGSSAYCEEHLRNHVHIRETEGTTE
jgi:hypothetical protein